MPRWHVLRERKNGRGSAVPRRELRKHPWPNDAVHRVRLEHIERCRLYIVHALLSWHLLPGGRCHQDVRGRHILVIPHGGLRQLRAWRLLEHRDRLRVERGDLVHALPRWVRVPVAGVGRRAVCCGLVPAATGPAVVREMPCEHLLPIAVHDKSPLRVWNFLP